MTILPATQGSPRGLSHLGSCSRKKISHEDGDGDENPPQLIRNQIMLPASQGPCILAYIKFYLYILITYNMCNINIRVNIVF